MTIECLYNELAGSDPTLNDCDRCSDYFDFPYGWCCLEVCGEQEMCRGCERGLYKVKGIDFNV